MIDLTKSKPLRCTKCGSVIYVVKYFAYLDHVVPFVLCGICDYYSFALDLIRNYQNDQ